MNPSAVARCGHCGAEFREDEMSGVLDLDQLECGFCGHVGTVRYFPGREPVWNEPNRLDEEEPLPREGEGSEEPEDRPPPARGRSKTP